MKELGDLKQGIAFDEEHFLDVLHLPWVNELRNVLFPNGLRWKRLYQMYSTSSTKRHQGFSTNIEFEIVIWDYV
jgi:hypothetical protein